MLKISNYILKVYSKLENYLYHTIYFIKLLRRRSSPNSNTLVADFPIVELQVDEIPMLKKSVAQIPMYQ